MRRLTLEDYGYPKEGIVYVDAGGGNDYEAPQERWTARTCGNCRLFDGEYCMKEWNNGEEDYCIPERDERDPDCDTCDDIDYIEEELTNLREPVRCEYSSEEAYKAACKAIYAILRSEVE